jgi:RNA polymerase sigma-70 factor (ECF subfamily)
MGIQDQQDLGTASPCSRPRDSASDDGQHASARLDELRRLVDEHIVSAEAAWPGVKVSDDDFFAFLSPCVTQERPLAESVDRLAIRDLYLACAALAGNKPAVAVLDDLAGEVARTTLARVGVADCVVDEVRQEYFVRLLLGSPSTVPLLQQYRGLAPLRSWLRLMMVRRAVHMKKREEKNRPY